MVQSWWGQDLAAAGSLWQKNCCLVQTSLYHTALHIGMVKFRHEDIWISVSDTRAWKSKMFSPLQVMPLLWGAFLAPPPPFEAYFAFNATFPLLSLSSLWKKQGTRVQWTGDKHFMQRFLSFCQAANYIYNNGKQQNFLYIWKMFSAIKIYNRKRFQKSTLDVRIIQLCIYAINTAKWFYTLGCTLPSLKINWKQIIFGIFQLQHQRFGCLAYMFQMENIRNCNAFCQYWSSQR